MAIDDNTLYGLTGAQVKEMVQRRGNTEISQESSTYGNEGESLSLDSNGTSGHLRVGVDIMNDGSEAFLYLNDSYPGIRFPSIDRMYEAIANGIPNNISYFYNDENYQSASQVSSAIASAMATKQDTLTAGTGISINNNVISASGGETMLVTISQTTIGQYSDVWVWSSNYTFAQLTANPDAIRVFVDDWCYASEGNIKPTDAKVRTSEQSTEIYLVRDLAGVEMSFILRQPRELEGQTVNPAIFNVTNFVDKNKTALLILPTLTLADNATYIPDGTTITLQTPSSDKEMYGEIGSSDCYPHREIITGNFMILPVRRKVGSGESYWVEEECLIMSVTRRGEPSVADSYIYKTFMFNGEYYKMTLTSDSYPNVVYTITKIPGGQAYTAGTGLALNGTQFSVDTTTVATQSDLTAGLAGKQDTLTAGTNITIDANNVISATGGGGTSTLTIAVTYDQQEEDEFTWSGATINEIKSAYNSGAEIYIPTRYMGTIKITSLSGDSQELYMTALYTGYQTCTFRLKSDGTGEVYWYELAQEKTLRDVEDSLSNRISNKQDKLTAGTGISITNGVISCTFANGNGVSY